MTHLVCTWLGTLPYREAMDVMENAFREVSAGGDPVLLLLEHAPVITLGRHADAGHILADAPTLAKRGVDVVETGRGGDVTFHGPGQLVGYPVMPVGRMVRRHVERIFGALEDMLRQAGIASRFDIESPGLWVGQDKIAAVGIEIREGISMHGFCLNVRREHEGFSYIIPCGITGRGVVYWSDFQNAPFIPDAARFFAGHFAARCHLQPFFDNSWQIAGNS